MFISGYRIKLHFDGYAEEYCFWVNADCPDLFYATWCEQNGRTVQPPKDYNKKFNWNIYLAECQAMAAPKCCFSSIKNLAVCDKNCNFFSYKYIVIFDLFFRNV